MTRRVELQAGIELSDQAGFPTIGSEGLGQPTASLTVQVFTFAITPFEEWQEQAWTGALVLMLLLFGVGLAASLALRGTDASRE
jgi:ABC-type phosphate transport system permease subunit